MITEEEIEVFIKAHNVKMQLLQSFKSLLEKNSEADLDIADKNIAIDISDIRTKITKSGALSFSASINDAEQQRLGYYALVFSLGGQLWDEFFVIE
ncbi:hypothetical protein ACTJIJ_08760 [Niabella sp. 22666]|uniref:hypothetical protein n=1 Tax=Niabella sp. 22666 TaxID=3453954 RepID=UPI003F83199F